jgi:predicted helicase
VYVLDLGGNVRKNPKLSGTTHNVFGIQVGVAITILVKATDHDISKRGNIFYASVGETWRKEQKYNQLSEWGDVRATPWNKLSPDTRNTWLTAGQQDEFSEFTAIGSKEKKGAQDCEAIFQLFSLGVATNRDAWTYNFSAERIAANLKKTASFVAHERHRFVALEPAARKKFTPAVDERAVKWTDRLIAAVKAGEPIKIDAERVRESLFRPFNKQFLYFDNLLNQRRYQQHYIFPVPDAENTCVCMNDIGYRASWSTIATNYIPDLHVLATSDGFQCFPFYTYDEEGKNRRENITDWALAEFRSHYGQKSITKLDIFHYVYALLHHPEYRTRYAANLKRELPRIPFAPDFCTYARIGCELMKLHIEYEQQPEFPLERTETGKLDWRVEKMVLSKDKTQLRYNSFLSFGGIPSEVYEYRLGNRSALEWIVDQYRVSTDKRSGIVNDPNRADDPEYIVRLVGQVVTVSLETVRLVRELAALPLLPPEPGSPS